MPIRPEMKHLYPPRKEWHAIRERILARAKHTCECDGSCGVPHNGKWCGVPNHELVVRYRDDDALETWHPHTHGTPCLVESCNASEFDGARVVRVVLTIAHLDHNPTNNVDSNLRALCQRCHLRYDRHEHLKNGHATRRRNRAIGWIPGVKP